MDPTQIHDPDELLDRMGIALPDRDHAVRCARCAGAIFDGARDLLELEPDDRRLAVVAALYHDAGYQRGGSRDHHRKSYDILDAATLPGFSRRDQIIAACVARYHGRTLPNIEHAGFGEMEVDDQRRTRRLSAIVRLAAACDASHLGLVTAVSARSVDDTLVVEVVASEEPSVERDRLREAAGGFTALTYAPIRVEIIVKR